MNIIVKQYRYLHNSGVPPPKTSEDDNSGVPPPKTSEDDNLEE